MKTNDPDPISTAGFDSVGEIYTGPGDSINNRFHLPGLDRRPPDALDIGLPGGAPGVLAELRGLEREVAYTRWGMLAKAVAALLEQVNSTAPLLSPAPHRTMRGPRTIIRPVLQNRTRHRSIWDRL